jgi:hypothetical protein
MTPLRALVVFLWLAILFAGSMWAKHASSESIIVVVHPRVDTTSVLDEMATGATPRLDLNGNEIDDAVGDYRVDRRGELYERHAPDTALLRLGSARL